MLYNTPLHILQMGMRTAKINVHAAYKCIAYTSNTMYIPNYNPCKYTVHQTISGQAYAYVLTYINKKLYTKLIYTYI